MYFVGKLVYLIILASVQLAVEFLNGLMSSSFFSSSRLKKFLLQICYMTSNWNQNNNIFPLFLDHCYAFDLLL